MHAGDVMPFPKEKAPYNLALWPIAFTSKSLTSASTQYGDNEREAVVI